MKLTIIVHLLKDTPRKFPGRRPQPFRYLVKNGGNHKFYEKSSENLTNRGDAIESIEDVHGPDATVILREEGQPDRILRQPATRRMELTDDEWRQLVDRVKQELTGAVVHHPRVLHHVVEYINDIVTPGPRGNVYDFTGIVDVPAIEDQINRQEDQP